MTLVTEIQIENFRQSMKLAQNSIYVGLSVAAVVQYLSVATGENELPAIPLIDLRFASVDSLQIALLILYIGAGLMACFSASRAYSILSSIKEVEISAEVSRYPSIIATSFIFSVPLAGLLLGSGMLLGWTVINSSYWVGFIVSTPFLIALQMGTRIYRHKYRHLKRADV